MLVAFFYAHLVVHKRQVNSTEYLGLTKLIEKIMYERHRKHVQTCLLIQTMKTNIHAMFTGLFAYEEDGCTVP